MLNFINCLNNSNILRENCMIVTCDIVNMFSTIDNESGLQALKSAVESQRRTISIYCLYN